MIDVKGITKRFGSFTALDNVDLCVEPGELVALLGPSGSGKTTLLRVIAGLEFPDAGSVHFEGREATSLEARDRRVGFVFQHFALFRHMTVRDNVSYGLRVRDRASRPPRETIDHKVDHLLSMVQLEGLADRYPSQLSGGQRQRVALARALAIEPRVLLLDEPFGALDAKVRKELRRWLRRLHDELGITGIFVTHDQEEALEVADRVVVMNKGRIEQIGTPTEIHDSPGTPFVYRFLGNVNSFTCRIENGVARVGDTQLALSADQEWSDGEATAFVRPHELDIIPAGVPQDPPLVGFPAVLRHAVVLGTLVRLEIEISPSEILDAEMPRKRFDAFGLRRGQQLLVAPRRAQLFLADGRQVAAVAEPAAAPPAASASLPRGQAEGSLRRPH